MPSTTEYVSNDDTSDRKMGHLMEKSTPHGLGQSVDLDKSYTPEEERRVVRKIDCIILPMVS